MIGARRAERVTQVAKPIAADADRSNIRVSDVIKTIRAGGPARLSTTRLPIKTEQRRSPISATRRSVPIENEHGVEHRRQRDLVTNASSRTRTSRKGR